MTHRTSVIALSVLLLAAGCSATSRTTSTQPDTARTRTQVVTIPVQPAGAGGDSILTSALPASAAAIRTVPDSMVLRVSDTLSLTAIRVLVLDSAGRTIGRLPLFDMSSGPMGGGTRAIRISGFLQLVAVRPGIDSIAIGVPAFQWQGAGPVPRASLRLIVR